MAIITRTIRRPSKTERFAKWLEVNMPLALLGIVMGFAGGMFSMVVFVGISEWIRILGG